MRIFPVRHHSPAAALQLQTLIRRLRPAVVLIEGPADADPLVDLLLDPETLPPVAVYAYRSADQVQSLFYPFCQYSPEYVALRTGREVGAEVRFCDLPARTQLSLQAEPRPLENGPSAEEGEAVASPPPDHRQALAEAAGFEDFEAFWEAAFEQDAASGTPEQFAAALAVYGAELRGLDGVQEQAPNERRERHMAAVARQAVAGATDDGLLLVCGAYHVAGVARFFAASEDPPETAEGEPAEVVLIPFSFTRLSEQTGYGAGNRAPWYCQQVWQRGGDYQAATRDALLAAMHHLRDNGRPVSIAQAIDAETLARQLAALRGKGAPGADELVDAAVSCYGYGETATVSQALRTVLIGDAVGRLTPRVGRTPLQKAFYATAQELGLPVRDAPQDLLVHLPQPREAAQSVFLHRLTVAQVPYAREIQSGIGGAGRDAAGGALGSLGRTLEKWQVQWTPSTDAALIERNAWGSTFEDVCGRLLMDRLAAAGRIDEAAEVLLELALCDLSAPFEAALARCEHLAGDSASFPALARSTYQLDGLLSYGTARALPMERIRDLSRRLFARAMVHLPSGAVCGDDSAPTVQDRLNALHELVQRESPAVVDVEAFWSAVLQVAMQTDSHPSVRGIALLLLELARRFQPGDLARHLRYWLSSATQPVDAARLVAALFSMHRGTLLRNRELIAAVTHFLMGLEMRALLPLLPVLRGTLGSLSSRERDYLSETLGNLLGVDGKAALEELRLPSEVMVTMRAANAAVAETLEQWRTRYGLE